VRKWFSDLSLAAKLVALCASLVLALAGVLLAELPRAMEAQSRVWIASRSLGLGRLLASAVEASLDFEDPAAAALALEGLRSTRGAAYAVLLRPDGGTFAAWREPGTDVVDPPGRGEVAVVVGPLLRVRVPVLTRSGKSGTLLLGFELEELEARRREARGSVLWTSALLLLCGLAGAVVIGTVLARPLRRMTEVAQRVAAGNTTEGRNLPVGRRDEVGVLATAFAQMLERLFAQQQQIGRINADLARRVQERTHELARTNEALGQLERTQEQLVMADRRISVGRLAAGVAHEINNPLSFLCGNLDYVASQIPRALGLLRAPAGEEVEARALLADLAGAVADAQQGGQRVAHIVRGLKTFARDDEGRRQEVALDGPLDAAIEMAIHEIKHRARLVRQVESVPWVLGNEVRLSQVFLNLLINAAQAIPEGAPSDRHQVRVRLGVHADGRALVEVADTGCGMSPEVLNRIFDPFFTTKPVGVGSGLGLSISHNIVAAFGGEIAVESTPGQGTTFRVLLPAVAPGGADEAPAPAPAPPLGGIRILVVDDEALVGQQLARALAREAEVVSTTSGREALELLAGQGPFDRILCDIMMPGMSGPELHAELVRTAPGQAARLVFMTGGAFTDAARAFAESWRGPLIEKPIDHDQLRRILHETR
jgi:signal transduction histidine kinase